MKNPLQSLEESIADKIKNYQKHLDFWNFDDEHVDTWIKQFPEEERIVVLTETDSLLVHNYMRKKEIRDFFDEIWSTEVIVGKKPELGLNKIQFLDIQYKGKSQKRLVDLIEKHYFKTKGIKINRCNQSNIKKYIYLDDCMFTGFTLLKDICNWVDNMNPNYGSKLDVIFLGEYNGNHKYILEQIKAKCATKEIDVDIYTLHEYHSDLNYKPPYDILWPQYMDDDEYVNNFINDMEEQKKNTGKGGLGFRNMDITDEESKLFTCRHNRIIFEKALLKKGAYICSLPQNRNIRMKPMGYNHGISFGFGAFFATCYNISNNCPLAFWWGDLWESSSNILGKWYPLLPREVNE